MMTLKQLERARERARERVRERERERELRDICIREEDHFFEIYIIELSIILSKKII